MTLTHRLALAAMFAGAAAFAQTSSSTTGSAGTTSKYDPTRAGSSTTASGATAEAGKAATTATKMSPSAILSMIHQVNQDEIAMGKMAQSRAQSDKVKDYAKDMVDDHTALDKKLTDFVQKEGKGQVHLSATQIPAAKREQMKAMNQEAERKLSSATGATFDREYISAMFKGHDAVLSDLDAALPSLEGKDKLHGFVSDARDKVKDHRDHANDILKNLDKSTATGGSGMQGSTGTTTPQSVGGGAPGATTGTRGTAAPGTTTPDTTTPSTQPSTTTPSNR